MNLSHKTSKIIITGQSGTGKSTYFTEYVLNSFQTVYDCIYIFDHQGEFSERTGKPAAFTENDLVERNKEGFVIFDPSEMFPGETETAWSFFCEWVFARCQANIGHPKLLAVDELQMFSSTTQVSWELSCVIETGRKYELDFCAITQQLNLVHNRVRNQATEVVTFRHVDKLVLDAIEQLGFNPEVVSALQDGCYIARDMQHSSETTGNIFTTCKLNNNQQTSKHQEGSKSDDVEPSEEKIESDQ